MSAGHRQVQRQPEGVVGRLGTALEAQQAARKAAE